MALKYIRHGATFCGDGTTKDLAGSNGGVGAWNTITILESATPPYGSIAAGDTTIIRSKDESGNDIVRTITAATNLGNAAGTVANPIRWIIDPGTVWAGISGTIKYTSNVSAGLASVRSANVILSTNKNFILEFTEPAAFIRNFVTLNESSRLSDVLIDWSTITSNEPGYMTFGSDSKLDNVKIKMSRQARNPLFSTNAYGVRVFLDDTEIEQLYGNVNAGSIFSGPQGAQYIINGGRLYGAGVNANISLTGSSGSNGQLVKASGFKFPITVSIAKTPLALQPALADLTGVEDFYGLPSAIILREWGILDGRLDSETPYYSATIPTSTPKSWSWKLSLFAAKASAPAVVPISNKLYTAASAVLTLRTNLLIATTLVSSVNKNNFYVVIRYTDSTGAARTETSKTVLITALADGTGWSSTSYGAIQFTQKKIEITTAAAVKQDTNISIQIVATVQMVDISENIFVCPDVLIV
jgi:hypothetical protein